MKLYEFMKLSQDDFDTYDTVYDAEVTACYIAENEAKDNYDKFCIELMKKVEVEKVVPESHLIVKWTELIQNNMEKFKEFARENWIYDYEDDEDEFIYQWIKEIHYYLAGYVSEDFYDVLVKFVDSLEERRI